VKLVACPSCHAQYDVDGFSGDAVACRCGTTFPATPPVARDAAVTRCAACGALVGPAERVCSYCQAEVTRRPEAAGPVCPKCYARNPAGARHCTSCGVAFLPQPVRAGGDALECPVCPGVRLGSRSLGGIWVDECPMCLGLWAPGDTMDRLVDRVREKRRSDRAATAADPKRRERRSEWQAEIAYRKCPECRVAMQRKNFGRHSGVILDWCASHGTWLDAHEMEDVAAFVLEGGLEGGPGASAAPESGLPADPERVAAVAAAERIIAEERARNAARAHEGEIGPRMISRGIGDLFALLLK
jgi:Zn-finger nucleic acid-binding protein